jgi:hypothetical protein
MDWKRIALGGVIAATLAAAPFADADARRWRRGGPLVWPFVAGAAVVGTAAAVATAPLRALAPPYYPYYYGAPAYYAPRYYRYYNPYYYPPGYGND